MSAGTEMSVMKYLKRIGVKPERIKPIKTSPMV